MERISSGTAWEEQVGYSRAIRAGRAVHVSGTTAADVTGAVAGGGNAHLQAVDILRKIGDHLEKLGAKRSDVVRTRIYLTRAGDWAEVGRAHAEFFAGCAPTTTMVVVAALLSPDLLVEIEAEAIVE